MSTERTVASWSPVSQRKSLAQALKSCLSLTSVSAPSLSSSLVKRYGFGRDHERHEKHESAFVSFVVASCWRHLFLLMNSSVIFRDARIQFTESHWRKVKGHASWRFGPYTIASERNALWWAGPDFPVCREADVTLENLFSLLCALGCSSLSIKSTSSGPDTKLSL